MNVQEHILHLLAGTQKRWLVTGAAGFIGSHITKALVKRGDSVIVIDNLVTGKEDNLKTVKDEIEFFKDDIVIVMWSFFDRWCVIKKDELKYIRHQESLFFKYFHDDYDMLLDFYLRINHIQSFLQNKVKLLKHTIAKENPNHMTLNYNPMEEKNENIYEVKKLIEKYPHEPRPQLLLAIMMFKKQNGDFTSQLEIFNNVRKAYLEEKKLDKLNIEFLKPDNFIGAVGSNFHVWLLKNSIHAGLNKKKKYYCLMGDYKFTNKKFSEQFKESL